MKFVSRTSFYLNHACAKSSSKVTTARDYINVTENHTMSTESASSRGRLLPSLLGILLLDEVLALGEAIDNCEGLK